jgi:hypothetical protein
VPGAAALLTKQREPQVYNEMVGSFQQPDFCGYHELNRLLYGWAEAGEAASAHPLAFEAGGTPQAIRTAVPAHLRGFHNDRYSLSSMGALIAVSPLTAAPRDLLARVHDCLAFADATPRPWLDGAPAPATRHPAAELEETWLPTARTAPPGTMRIARVPIAAATALGQLVAAWPNTMPPHVLAEPDAGVQLSLLHLLVEMVAGGATSELHSALIATETRICALRATGISGYVSGEPGRAVCLGLGGLPPAEVTEEAIRGVCETMQAAFSRIAALPDASAALEAFNGRALSHLRTMQRGSCQFLASPPRFGVRGVHDEWLAHMQDARRCSKPGAAVVFLSFVAEAAALQRMLTDAANPWSRLIERCGLASRLPLAVATRADSAFAAELEQQRDARMAAYVDGLLAEEARLSDGSMPVDAAQLRAAAFARFRGAYDAATAVIDAAAASTPTPEPPRDPPMAEDELDSETMTLPGGGRLFGARFLGLTGGHVGLALSLAGVPRRLLGVLCALPELLRNVGVTTRAGKFVEYRELCRCLQSSVLYLDPSFTTSRKSGRVELQLRAAGLTLRETTTALEWLEAMLTAPDLTSGCLARVRDGVDAALSSARATVERRGEFWVDSVAASILPNASPVFLLAGSHISRAHALHRLRWRLRDVPADAPAACALLALLAAALDAGATRAELDGALEATAAADGAWPSGIRGGDALHASFIAAPPGVQATLRAAAADLRCLLPCVPDASLAADWKAMCCDLAADMLNPPSSVLSDWAELLTLLRCRSRARAFLAAGPAHFTPLAAAMRALVARLPAGAGAHGGIACTEPVTSTALTRAAARGALPGGGAAVPPYVALLIPRLSVGGVVSMAACASYADDACDEERLLDLLAVQSVAGGGAHSLFMRGWSSGLAYSCGVSCGLAEGRMRYYADTCPDVGRCMAAAALEVTTDERAAPALWRAEYALAQCFTSRAGTATPEARAEAAASDEADGRGAARVRALRTALLRLRSRSDLGLELHRRAPRVLGALLPGVPSQPLAREGWTGAADAPGMTLVVVGCERQAERVDALLRAAAAAAAPPACVRLYERDLWVVAGAAQPPRLRWKLPDSAPLLAAAAAAALALALARSRLSR